MLARLIMLLILCAYPSIAGAGGSYTTRIPTSTSIPCPGGKVTEIYAEAGGMSYQSGSVSLFCVDGRSHASWVLLSAVSCHTDTMNINCHMPVGEPVATFAAVKGPLTEFHVTKYVVGEDCTRLPKLTDSTGWSCRTMKFFDGSGQGRKKAHYTTIITIDSRPPEGADADGHIVGLDPSRYSYIVDIKGGVPKVVTTPSLVQSGSAPGTFVAHVIDADIENIGRGGIQMSDRFFSKDLMLVFKRALVDNPYSGDLLIGVDGVMKVEVNSIRLGEHTNESAKVYATLSVTCGEGRVVFGTKIHRPIFSLVLQGGVWKIDDIDHNMPDQSTGAKPGAMLPSLKTWAKEGL